MHFNGSGEKWFVTHVLVSTKPKTIIDVGANIGEYSKLLIDKTEAKVFAIEPNPHSFSKLSELPERVTKVPYAISNQSGEAKLHFRSNCDEQASLDPMRSTSNSVTVKVKTLVDIVNEYSIGEIDFVKIDTEGF